MDYHNDNEPWDWHGGDYSIHKDSNTDMSDCLWNEVSQNEEDLSYMFHETTTPIRACGDLAYHVTHSDTRNKEPEESRETYSQVKSRRMLQFNAQSTDFPNCNEDMSSIFLKSSEKEDSVEEILPEASQWVSGFSGITRGHVMHKLISVVSTTLFFYFASCPLFLFAFLVRFFFNFDRVTVIEFCPPEHEANAIQQPVSRTPKNIIIKGRKSYIRPPIKLASSIAYPFAFIKHCGVHGDVTLKDINQRICTPPPSKSKQSNEDLIAAFPTSAFSGKPVVGKTKIRTEGGKGSITIMRTKG